MNDETLTAVLLIAVPIAFNVAFFELGRVFDYPRILRMDPGEILRRFQAGGPGLIVRWELLLISALSMLPLVALLASVLPSSSALTYLGLATGSAASLVQAIGLVRWPFVVPELARRYVDAPEGPTGDGVRTTIEVTFATIHRLFGIGIGEHLGYLLTGIWTLVIAISIATSSLLPAWLGLAGLPIGAALMVGSLEFVGHNERRGWPLAGLIVPIAYIAWSLWLIAIGIMLLA